MIVLEDAVKTLLDESRKAKHVRVPLNKCWGRVLAEDIISDIDFPPFDRSPLDGYAVRRGDIEAASMINPISLAQTEYVPAGTWPKHRIGAGEAARIMTGAKVPDGADAVVRLEDTKSDCVQVLIFNPEQSEKCICRQGEEFK